MEDRLMKVSGTKFPELSTEFLDLKFCLSIYLSTFSIRQVATI